MNELIIEDKLRDRKQNIKLKLYELTALDNLDLLENLISIISDNNPEIELLLKNFIGYQDNDDNIKLSEEELTKKIFEILSKGILKLIKLSKTDKMNIYKKAFQNVYFIETIDTMNATVDNEIKLTIDLLNNIIYNPITLYSVISSILIKRMDFLLNSDEKSD